MSKPLSAKGWAVYAVERALRRPNICFVPTVSERQREGEGLFVRLDTPGFSEKGSAIEGIGSDEGARYPSPPRLAKNS